MTNHSIKEGQVWSITDECNQLIKERNSSKNNVEKVVISEGFAGDGFVKVRECGNYYEMRIPRDHLKALLSEWDS